MTKPRLSDAEEQAVERIGQQIERGMLAVVKDALASPDGIGVSREIVEAIVGRGAIRIAATMAVANDIPREDFLTGCKNDYDWLFAYMHEPKGTDR